MIRPEEIAAAVLYLAADESRDGDRKLFNYRWRLECRKIS